MLSVRDMHSGRAGLEVLRGIDLDVAEGTIAAVIGANGAGKTALLTAICGHLPARAREIRFCGEDIARLPPLERIERGIAIVPENPRIFADLTVSENLKMGALGISRAVAASARDEVLALFPSLRQRLTDRGGRLSAAEQQMLSFARALMSRPRLLLADEPSRGLAPAAVRQTFDMLAGLRREKHMAILIAEQNAFQALKLADRAFAMVNGRIVQSGSGMEVLSDPCVQPAYFGGSGSDPRQAAAS